MKSLFQYNVPKKRKLWYAVRKNPSDGLEFGSYNLEVAKALARAQAHDFPETIISAIAHYRKPDFVATITDFSPENF